MHKLTKLVLSGTAAILCCGQASAAIEWTLTGTPSPGVTIAGYANTGNVGTATQNHLNNGAIQTIQSAPMASYSGGVGITNLDKCATSGSTKCDRNEGVSPEHAIDNQERYEMALLTFTQAVELTKVKIGWKSNDSDISVLAYTGTGVPNTDIGAAVKSFVGLNYTQLVSNGWSFIGHYTNLSTTSAKTINPLHITSSHWLIGAYNPLVVTPLASAASAASSTAQSYDYVKLVSVIGLMAAPEPGSVALVGLAVIGLLAVRARAA